MLISTKIGNVVRIVKIFADTAGVFQGGLKWYGIASRIHPADPDIWAQLNDDYDDAYYEPIIPKNAVIIDFMYCTL